MTMKTIFALAPLVLVLPVACATPAAQKPPVERSLMSAQLEGGSYKALQLNDPIYADVVDVATRAAYAAAPTRALVQRASVMQGPKGDYLVNIEMSGGDRDGADRLVVVSIDKDGKLVSRGTILY